MPISIHVSRLCMHRGPILNIDDREVHHTLIIIHRYSSKPEAHARRNLHHRLTRPCFRSRAQSHCNMIFLLARVSLLLLSLLSMNFVGLKPQQHPSSSSSAPFLKRRVKCRGCLDDRAKKGGDNRHRHQTILPLPRKPHPSSSSSL